MFRQGRAHTGVFTLALVFGISFGDQATAQTTTNFLRGDANYNQSVDIADAVYILGYLFTGGPAPLCLPISDTNVSGRLDIADAITLLTVLFIRPSELSPLNFEEEEVCEEADILPPPPVTVLRHGEFTTLQHGVQGRVEHLSDRTIRLRFFNFDGKGLPSVYVWLSDSRSLDDMIAGYAISEDLRRNNFYIDETLIYPIPPEVTSEMFNHVSIWCTAFPLSYGYAFLFRKG